MVSLSGVRQGGRKRDFTSPFAAEFKQYGASERSVLARDFGEALVGVVKCAFRAFENNGEAIGACAEEGGPKIIEGFARNMQKLTAPINMFRGIGGKLNRLISTVPALQGVLHAKAHRWNNRQDLQDRASIE